MDESSKKSHPEFIKLVESLKAGDMRLLDKLYVDKRKEFVKWIYAEYKVSEEDAIDFFQAAILIVYENIMAGKADAVSGSPSTYLFAIGKNLALNKFYNNERHLNHLQRIQWFLQDDDQIDDETALLAQAAKQVLEKMEEPCHGLLMLFYYENLSMEQIAQRLHYKNKDVVKSQKVRCLKYLKEELLKALPKKD